MIGRLLLILESELHRADVFAFVENPFLNSILGSKHFHVLKHLENVIQVFSNVRRNT